MSPLAPHQDVDTCRKSNPDPAFGEDAKGPTDRMPEEIQSEQVPVDLIEEASMESFPCSDPPSYTRCHV